MDTYAVIGNPVAHSLSPYIHQTFAKTLDQDIHYHRLLSPLDKFKETTAQFWSENGNGLNITAPFKEEACQLCDVLSLCAKRAGAVNTLMRQPSDNLIYGTNTDGYGLTIDIMDNLHWPIKNKTILIVGAGGAVRGILASLIEEAPMHIMIVNRTEARIKKVIETFLPLAEAHNVRLSAYLPKQSFDMLINTVKGPLDWRAFIHPDVFQIGYFYYDILYNQAEHDFLKCAVQAGVQHYANGIGMLVEQASLSFGLWRNVLPKTERIIETLKRRYR